MKTTPIVRCSYLNMISAKESEDGASAAWQGTAMLDKKNPEHMAWLKEASAEYLTKLVEFYPDAAKRPRIPFTGHEKSPCKDGDTATNSMGIPLVEKNPEYAGHYLLRFGAVAKTTNTTTGEVKHFKRQHFVIGNQKVNGAWVALTDDNEIYGGCLGRFAGNFYKRNRTDNPGVSIGLQGFQKTGDAEPFGAPRINPNDAFGELPGENDPNNYAADPFADGSGL